MTNTNPSMVIKTMVTIVDRGKRNQVIDILTKEHIHFHYLCFGLGTASSELLDYLGIGEPKKDIIISLLPAGKVPQAQQRLSYELHLEKPGKGIVFTLPLSGMTGKVSQAICENCIIESGETDMENKAKYELVMAIVNQGYVDLVMEAARSVGATGGTVVNGRGIGHDDAEKFLGLSIQSEKEIVTILVKKELKSQIMHEISVVAGLNTDAKGILLSLPVDSIVGLQ